MKEAIAQPGNLHVNGSVSSKVIWWIITTLTGLALGIGGSTISNHHASIVAHTERLATLEAERKADAQRLNRIEDKIDQILERMRK